MGIQRKIIINILVIITLVAILASYYSPRLGLSGSFAVLLPTYLIIAIITTMVVLVILVTRNVLLPLKDLNKYATQIAKGNFDFGVYNGKIGDKIRINDELSRLVLTFETMRRRVLNLNNNFNKLIREKTLELERVNNELIEKEKVLQRTNSRLIGQSEELKKINEGLSLTNKELSAANAKLQKIDAMKTDFIEIAAHELRTPIQPIMGFVGLAEKGLISNEQAWKVISTETKKLANLATYILDVSKIEHGTFTYRMKLLSIAQLVESISSSPKFRADDSVAIINFHLDPDVKILGDVDRLIQAFTNLISNAIKFAKNGAVNIRTRNLYDKGVVEIEIADDGPGIPSEILPVLFKKFVTRTEANQGGTGLGLFITKSIIEAHQGSVKAENNIERGGKGATFTVSLPIYDQHVPTPLTGTQRGMLQSEQKQ